MKVESKKLTNSTTVKNIIDAVNEYYQDIINEFPKDEQINIKITSIKVDLKTKSVYITYDDYSEERQKMTKILQDALSIDKELKDEQSKDKPNLVKIASLQNELAKLDNEYYELSKIVGTPIHIYDLL